MLATRIFARYVNNIINSSNWTSSNTNNSCCINNNYITRESCYSAYPSWQIQSRPKPANSFIVSLDRRSPAPAGCSAACGRSVTSQRLVSYNARFR